MSEKQNAFVDGYDRDEDIEKKKAILEEAKAIPSDANYRDVMPQISALQKRWKKLGDGQSYSEQELRREFDEVLNVFYAQQKEAQKDVISLKEEIIKKVEALSSSTNMNKATNEMNALFEEWKSAGSAGKDDDELWEKFKTARKSFNESRRKFNEDRAKQIEEAQVIKKQLIEEVKKYEDSTDWKNTSAKMDELMEQWKKAGYAGKELNDSLWDEFNSSRKKFFDARSEFYTQQHAEFAEKNKQKIELIAKAKELVAENNFSKEMTDELKALQASWKEIGYSGKDKEEKLWNEFKGTLDVYYEGRKQYNAQRHEDWVAHQEALYDRKQSLLEKQKGILARMEKDLDSIIGEDAYEEMRLDIEDKEDFIAQLEEELQEISERLNPKEKEAEETVKAEE